MGKSEGVGSLVHNSLHKADKNPPIPLATSVKVSRPLLSKETAKSKLDKTFPKPKNQ